jgi:hypothetical protein
MSEKIRDIHIPLFRESQVNKRLDANDQPTGEIIPFKEVLQTNMSAAIEAALGAFGDDESKPMAFVCFTQKDGDERKIGIACFPFNHDDTEELNVNLYMDIKPKFTIVGKTWVDEEK